MDFSADFEIDDLPFVAASTSGADMEDSRNSESGGVDAGVYPDMSNEVYHSQHDWISRGGIALLNHSPTKFRYSQMATGGKSTVAMDVGSLFHDLVMFGEDFVSRHYLKEPKVNKRTNDGKEELAQFYCLIAENQVVIPDEEWDLVRYMRDSVFKNTLAKELLEDGSTCFEHSHFAVKKIETLAGIKEVNVRVRPDIKNKGFRVIADLKSIAPGVKWIDAVLSHGYDLQSVMYPDVVMESEACQIDQFWFLTTEKTKDNPVTEFRTLDAWYQEQGLSKYISGMKRFAELNDSGDWFMPRATEKPRWVKGEN